MPLSIGDKVWLIKQFNQVKGMVIMATQEEVDAITDQLDALKSKLVDDDSAIQTALADLASQHPDVDLTALHAAVDGLSTQVDDTTALVPAPAPAAPVTGVPTSVVNAGDNPAAVPPN